jgi:hypothetical protein
VGGFGVVEAVGHGRVLAVTGRAHRGLRGDHPAGGGPDRHPQAKPEGRSAAEDGGARLSCLARKRPVRAAGKKVARRRCGEGPAPARSPARRPWAYRPWFEGWLTDRSVCGDYAS